MQLYAITDRSLFADLASLIEQAGRWAESGVHFIQIREKDLSPDALESFAARIVKQVREGGSSTKVLLNGPLEIAVNAGCDGIHLPSGMPPDAPARARAVFEREGKGAIVSVSCHTVEEIEAARENGASLALFAPVFEKKTAAGAIPGQGLEALVAACRVASPMPVFALGGVTRENAFACIRAGAAGIAAIRLFHLSY